MKRTKRSMLTALALFVAVAMTACGGGGGGGDAAAPTPIPLINSSSIGVVTGLGSVIVNGITYSTTNATVTMDDNPSTADQLKVGMVVMVRGTFDDAAGTGTAVEVDARDALEGTISATGTNTLTVMGQTVQIEDNVTRLNDDNAVKTFAAANFAVGERVEVHAFPDDNGGLRATRVAKKATGEFEMKGFVTALAGTSFGLSLTPTGASVMTVNFTGALPAGVAAGSFVHVRSAAAPAGGAITASAITLEDAIGAASQKIKVEGVVTSGTVDSFIVNGHPVLTNAATLFVGGLKTDFLLGVKLEAEGPLDASRNIVATKVSFRGNIRIEADATASSATSLTVLGKQVAVNQYTRIDNGPVAVGSHVEVRAFADRDGNPIASRIIVRNPNARVFLQAPVTATGLGTLTILGTTVNTNATTEFRTSSDAAEAAVASATFFAQLKPNVTVVKARWANAAAFTAGAAAEQAEIEVSKTVLSTNNAASQGVVTALGSVLVNGILFHTGSAAVMVDGVPATEASLREGMVVNVRGTIDDATRTGTAALVTATNAMEGTIEAVGANTLTVMGLPVRIEDNVTRLNDDAAVKTFAAGAFAAGQVVEVNGFFDDNGGLRATRVAKKASGQFEVKGFVVDPIAAGSFGLSLTPGGVAALTVNFTGTLPAGVVAGAIVEVKAAAGPAGGVVTATLVKLDDSLGAGGEKAKVEGIVMSGGNVTSFTINGQRVTTNAATLFEGGLPGDFLVGGKLEAEGFLDASGAIVATKISFRSSIRFEADITAIGALRSSVTLNIGKTIAINQFTRDDPAAVVGRNVEVRAYLDRDGNLIASRIVDRGAGSNNNRIEVQGPVTSPDGTLGTMTILGVPISTAGATFRISSTATDLPVQAPAFFAQLKNGVTVVKVRWNRLQDFTNGVAVVQAEIQLGK